MTSERQLTIDGREMPMSEVGRARALSHAQRDILRVIGLRGQIHSAEAGRILHVHHDPDTAPHRARYAGSDGWRSLMRLQHRGLVRKVARGVWQAASHD